MLSEKGNNDEMSCCFLSAMKKSEGGRVLKTWKWCVYIEKGDTKSGKKNIHLL